MKRKNNILLKEKQNNLHNKWQGCLKFIFVWSIYGVALLKLLESNNNSNSNNINSST